MNNETFKKNIEKLNHLISTGNTIEAMELFYDDNVIMQENQERPRVGKTVCINHEKENLRKTKIISGRLLNQAINFEKWVVFSEWEFNFTTLDGTNYNFTEVSVQQWNEHRVVEERFYYQKILKI
jgi:hypothetical protein